MNRTNANLRLITLIDSFFLLVVRNEIDLNIGRSIFIKMGPIIIRKCLHFFFNHFLEASAENVETFLFVFWETSKFSSEIT